MWRPIGADVEELKQKKEVKGVEQIEGVKRVEERYQITGKHDVDTAVLINMLGPIRKRNSIWKDLGFEIFKDTNITSEGAEYERFDQ